MNLDGKKYYWEYTDRQRGKRISRGFATFEAAKKYANVMRRGWTQASLWDKSNPFSHHQVGYIGISGGWWGYSKTTGILSPKSGRSKEIRIFP